MAYMLLALILGGGVLCLASIEPALRGRRAVAIPSTIVSDAPQRRYLTFLLLAVALWSFSYALELVVSGEAASIGLHRLAYLGIAAAPPVVLLAAIEATPRASQVYRAIAYLGLGGAGITATLSSFGSAVWTASETVDWHGLSPVHVEHGPWFMVHAALSYLCLGSAAVLLLSRLRAATDLRRLDVVATLTAMSLPWALNAAHLFSGLGGPIDPTPVAFAGTASLLSWLVRRDDLPRIGRRSKHFALEFHPEPYLLANLQGQVLDANGAGRRFLEALGAPDLTQLPSLLSLLGHPGHEAQELSVRLADGANRHLAVHVFEIPSLGSSLRGIVLRDITSQRETEHSLVEQAHFDPLTGLPNRRLFYKQLGVSFARAKVKGCSVALLLLDLDRFKEINDSLGHSAGDTLLKAVAELTHAAVRSRDVVSRLGSVAGVEGPARLGGDEFAIVLSEISRPEEASDVAERILLTLNTPLASDAGETMVPSASIGVAVFPQDGEDPDSLFAAADQALYQAKERGGNQCQVFHPALNRKAQRRLIIRTELRKALQSNQLNVVYQPKIDLDQDRICGAEALLRWQHPSLGPLAPSEFVGVAETCGLADELGRYVLERVCRDIAHYEVEGSGMGAISVNVSPAELARPEYFGVLAAMLREHGIRPDSLQLEITERTLLDESHVTSTNLRDIRAIGVAVYLDDFGTGRSSLSDLLKHRVDGIKLDRAFVSEMVSDRVAAGVVRSILQLASELDLNVVAEGIENGEEAAILRDLGCQEAQGYFWAKGLPAAEFFAPEPQARSSVAT